MNKDMEILDILKDIREEIIRLEVMTDLLRKEIIEEGGKKEVFCSKVRMFNLTYFV